MFAYKKKIMCWRNKQPRSKNNLQPEQNHVVWKQNRPPLTKKGWVKMKKTKRSVTKSCSQQIQNQCRVKIRTNTAIASTLPQNLGWDKYGQNRIFPNLHHEPATSGVENCQKVGLEHFFCLKSQNIFKKQATKMPNC